MPLTYDPPPLPLGADSDEFQPLGIVSAEILEACRLADDAIQAFITSWRGPFDDDTEEG